MDPQKEREFFLELLTKGLQHLVERGRRLADDIHGDVGIGRGMSALKLGIQAESIFVLVDGHRVAKESYMSGAWVKDERPLCDRYVAVIKRYKSEIIGSLLAVASESDSSKSKSGGLLSRLRTWFSPGWREREEREKRAQAFWKPGALGDELTAVRESLREIITEAEQLIMEANSRK